MRFIRHAAAALAATAAVAGPAAAQTTAPAQPAPPKVAYVNSQRILQQAPGWTEAQAQFEREMTAYRQQVQRMGDSLNTLIAAYDKAEITLSPAAKETKQKEIRAKEEEYQQRTAQMQQQMQQRQMELAQPIMERVQKILEEIRAEDSYAFIFDAGSNAGVIVAADKNLDLTDRVVARLRALATRTPGADPKAKPAAGAPVPSPAGVTRPKPQR